MNRKLALFVLIAAAAFVLTDTGFAQDTAERVGAGAEAAEKGGSGNVSDLVMCIVYATVALVFSSLCSVAEAVLLSVSPSYIGNLESSGDKSAAVSYTHLTLPTKA